MGTIVRHNERSWAIVIISEIKAMLKGMNLKIKSAGGESTLSVNKEIFDRKILRAIGHEELYDAKKGSLLSMQYTRHTVR